MIHRLDVQVGDLVAIDQRIGNQPSVNCSRLFMVVQETVEMLVGGFGLKDLEEAAREDGREAGISAASHVEINSYETARRWLDGIREGDPEILDRLPSINLSGEFADAPTPRTVAETLGFDDGPLGNYDSDTENILDELCDVWVTAANDAVQHEVERRAFAYMLAEELSH